MGRIGEVRLGSTCDIQLSSRVTAAHYQEATRSWDVALEDGSR
jgi:hypothetical protein